jgi:putative membrane protein
LHAVGTWRSLVARTLGVREVAGSNPVVPTIRFCFRPSDFRVHAYALMTAPNAAAERASLSDHLAAERTFLAWIRTGLALMGFGFVVARFGLFLEQLQFIQHAAAGVSYGLSVWFGTALIGAGVLVFIISSIDHVRLVRELNRGERFSPRPSTQAVAIALFLALVGIAMAIYLVSVRPS